VAHALAADPPWPLPPSPAAAARAPLEAALAGLDPHARYAAVNDAKDALNDGVRMLAEPLPAGAGYLHDKVAPRLPAPACLPACLPGEQQAGGAHMVAPAGRLLLVPAPGAGAGQAGAGWLAGSLGARGFSRGRTGPVAVWVPCCWCGCHAPPSWPPPADPLAAPG
jgi:hypothetical protein